MKESRDVRGLAWGLLFLFLCPVLFLVTMTVIDNATRTDKSGESVKHETTPTEEGTPAETAPQVGTPAPETPSAETPSVETPSAEAPTDATPSDATPQAGTPVSQAPIFGDAVDPSASDVSFTADIVPIFEKYCYQCHGPDRVPGVPTSYSLVSYDTTVQGALIPAVVPGNPEKSSLYLGVRTYDMPRTGEHLTDAEIELIRLWILQGAVNN